MTEEQIIAFVIYTVCMVYFVFRSGEKSGRVQMVEDMLDRGLVKHKDLIDKYNIE